MNMAESLSVLKVELLQDVVPQIVTLLQTGMDQGQAVHDVEQGLWDLLLGIGHQALAAFFQAHGSGDLGETITLPDGRETRRLDGLHNRSYISIFGRFTLARAVYGSREGQAIDFVPLDNRLQLPAGAFSYVLQDWDQALAVEDAFSQVNTTIERMLHVRQSVGSLETMNRQMAQDVADFRELQPPPPAAEEGAIVVLSGDCKGIVIRGQGTPTVCGGERPGGARANQKRMATVGAVYTIAPYERTPEDVVAALFRDENYQAEPRPKPCHKHVWASLPVTGPPPETSINVTFDWLQWELAQRNADGRRVTVTLFDGQEALWQASAERLPQGNTVGVLDVLHVTPRLWGAGKLLLGDKSPLLVPFVRHKVWQVLSGKVETVVRSLRQQGRDQGLKGTKKKALKRICAYLWKNRARMRYDDYLRAGYPIASGVIEGACRHLVKDRMERAGMHWTIEGAQAMLDLRSVAICGQWEEYQVHRIEEEIAGLYPHRDLVAGEAFFALAV
jgi:hypothetical protein